MKRTNVCNVQVSSINIPQACNIIDEWIKEKKKAYICVAPASTIVDCQADPEYKKVVDQADMVTPDGMPVVWTARLKGDKNIRRTYGPDLMLALCDKGQSQKYRHYIYGGRESTCDLLKNVLKQKFSNINIVGNYSPPLREIHARESAQIVEKINSLNPDILWVGLGSPKQDYWMYEHRDQLNVPVMIGVGAAFDFLAGVKKQAPKWMQKSGLEWFFRFCCEPKRLWRRYIIGNTKFVFYVVKDLLWRN